MPRKKKEKAGVEGVIEQGQRLVKTSLALGYDVWRRAKIKALETGLTLAQVTEAALEKYLEREKKKSKE